MGSSALAPGARVLIRDAEWIVKRKDRTSTGGYSIHVVGVSEIVRHREARFLTDIEGKGITVLDPADTDLIVDTSPQFRNSRLYLESLFRQSPPTGADLWIGHRAAVDDLPFQLDPAIQALEQPRQRILIADAVGLGKTIEIGVLLAELIKRGKGKRILAVTTKSMMAQFQKELWSRFTIPLVRLDSVGLDRIRSRIPTNANPFHYFDKSIISIDTLKQNNEYRIHLENSYWDVIVIDEAHNVAVRGSGKSLRAKLAELLSQRSDTLIMASATPHDGRAESFASLMNMLNPTAIADPKNYGPEDIKGLFLRRFKKHIQQQIAGSFLDRIVSRHPVAASGKEEDAYAQLAKAKFISFDRAKRTGQLLFRTVLEKALFSSPAACLETVRQRLKKLEKNTSPEADADRETLSELAETLAAIAPVDFPKYRELIKLLEPGGYLQWNPADPADRVVLFTERIETLRFLKENLPRDLRLKDNQVATIHGTEMSDVEIQEVVEAFGREPSPIRLLLASDIASEGLNLHFLSHKLIHFDIPWSLMVFQQRNGRIDRYGQERQPQIAYLYTEPSNEKIRGDIRILELLVEKDTQAAENIGDPSIFQGVFDPHEEELKTGKAIEDEVSPGDYERQMQEAVQNDLLNILFGDQPVPDGQQSRQRCRAVPTLYKDDLAFLEDALTSLQPQTDLQADFDTARQLVSLTLNDDLKRAFGNLPREAFPEDDRLTLSTDRRLVKDAIKRSRAEEQKWPDVHLLWDLHPVVEWLNFKLLVTFQRRQAPVIRLAGNLPAGDSMFLMQAEIPNKKGQPVIHEWFALHYSGMAEKGILPLEEFLERTQLGRRNYPNPGGFDVPVALSSLLPDAVRAARLHMSDRRKAFEESFRSRLAEEIETLTHLHDRHHRQLELDLPETQSIMALQRSRKEQRRRRIDEVFENYQTWVEETLTTEDQPFLRVAAVFIG